MLDERREAEKSVNDDNPSQTTETKTTTHPGDDGDAGDVVVVHWLLFIKMREIRRAKKAISVFSATEHVEQLGTWHGAGVAYGLAELRVQP